MHELTIDLSARKLILTARLIIGLTEHPAAHENFFSIILQTGSLMKNIDFEDLEVTVVPVGSSNTVTGLPCVRIIIWLIVRKKSL